MDLVRFPHPWMSSSHKAVMDVEVEFFHKNFTEQNPKPLTDHIQAMASGKAPFFPTTLSSVYGKMLRSTFPQPVASGSGVGNSLVAANRSASGLFAPPPPSGTTPRMELLKCRKCGEQAKLQDLFNSLYCPRCPREGFFSIPPAMECPVCGSWRAVKTDKCSGLLCPGVTFM